MCWTEMDALSCLTDRFNRRQTTYRFFLLRLSISIALLNASSSSRPSIKGGAAAAPRRRPVSSQSSWQTGSHSFTGCLSVRLSEVKDHR